MDVTSLYTNTPHRKCLLALKHFFDLRVEDDGLPSTFGLPSTNVVLFVLSRLFFVILGSVCGQPVSLFCSTYLFWFLKEQIDKLRVH